MSHRKLAAALVAAASLLPLAAAPASADAAAGDVSVMTRNLYLGADLIPLATQPSREAFEQAAAQRFQTVLANDYPTRAKAIAKEIRAQKPDVLAIQEAAVWKRSPDGVKDGNATEASITVYDSLALLDKELKALGQRYRLVTKRAWFDYEAPTALGYDVRLTQQDAILVRTNAGSRVKAGKAFKGGFTQHFDPPTQVGVARQLRGWVGFDGRVGKRRVRFVSTHLEAYDPKIGEQQMDQLLTKGPLVSKTRRTVLIGDLNSDPKSASADDRGAEREPNAYQAAITAGFVNPLTRRETCCFGEDLRPASGKLSSWIDHILVRPRIKAIRSTIVGSRSSERSGGLWPSDHAGIVATLRVR